VVRHHYERIDAGAGRLPREPPDRAVHDLPGWSQDDAPAMNLSERASALMRTDRHEIRPRRAVVVPREADGPARMAAGVGGPRWREAETLKTDAEGALSPRGLMRTPFRLGRAS